MPRLGLVGDVMLGRKVDERQRERAADAVWADGVLDRLDRLDGFLINLECCLSTRGTRWTRTYRPFHFRADPGWALPALRAANVDACALANNHLLDFGETALEDTIDALDEGGIAHAGAGRDLDRALDPAVFAVGESTAAVLAFTDNTPEYAAEADAPGVARVEFDVDDDRSTALVSRAIDRAAAAEPDLLIASLHWGPNMVAEPASSFQRFARWLVEQGVDMIHGHSAHAFQGIEILEGVPVLYDTGDFVDDYAVDEELRNDRSFLFEIELTSHGEPTALELRPTEIADCQVRLASSAAARWSRERMRELSAPFGTGFERVDDGLRCQL
jgi:poly-gamma-glutamate synthesis protein (capsule biosynthesis protein)